MFKHKLAIACISICSGAILSAADPQPYATNKAPWFCVKVSKNFEPVAGGNLLPARTLCLHTAASQLANVIPKTFIPPIRTYASCNLLVLTKLFNVPIQRGIPVCVDDILKHKEVIATLLHNFTQHKTNPDRPAPSKPTAVRRTYQDKLAELDNQFKELITKLQPRKLLTSECILQVTPLPNVLAAIATNYLYTIDSTYSFMPPTIPFLHKTTGMEKTAVEYEGEIRAQLSKTRKDRLACYRIK